MGTRARPKPKHLAAKLLAIRNHLGVSQSEIVRLLDFQVSSARVSEYETGTREPNLLTLLAYSRVAAIPLEKVFDDTITLTQFRDALNENIPPAEPQKTPKTV